MVISFLGVRTDTRFWNPHMETCIICIIKREKIPSNILPPSNTKYSQSQFVKIGYMKREMKREVMIFAVPCNKSVPSNLSVKSVLNNRQLKKIGGIFYCATKLNFKIVSWLPFLSILTVGKRNKSKVNTRKFASD